MSRKTILFFDHTALPGGGEIALFNLVRELDWDSYYPVVVLGADGELYHKLRGSGVETHIIPLDASLAGTRKGTLGIGSVLRLAELPRLLNYCKKLARFIVKRGVDAVHTNSLKADILGGIAGCLARVPVIWHVRDRIESDYLPGPAVRVFRGLCRWIPHFVIANSHATLETLRLPEGTAAVAYSGLVVHDGIPVEFEVEQKKRTGFPLIVLVGRISPWKGQHIFLTAATRVRVQFPDARFQIIGSAMFGEEDYEKRIRAMVMELGLKECVEFTGFRADVSRFIQAADVLVHASTTGEPFGQVVIEGMAACKPVVATNGGGIPEIVRDDETGILVPMGDAPAMADALVRLLSDPAGAAAMGMAGRKRVLAHFTIRHTARNVEAVYRRIFSTAPTVSALALTGAVRNSG